DMPWITTSELRETIITDTSQKITDLALDKVSSLKVYKPGAIAIAMYGATIGRLGILGIESTVNQACCVYDDPREFFSKFLYYWLWMSRNTLIAFSTGGGQPNLSQDDLKQLRIPIPIIAEQTIIARFLDQKTSQIDGLIKKKEKLLKLLAEKRTTIITQAVTKGLDPDVEMKDSGIDLIGHLPLSWKISKIKFNGRTRYGLGEPPPKKEDGLPFIRATDIYRGKIDLENIQFIDPDFIPWSKKPTLHQGEILVVRSGAYTGDSAIVTKECDGFIAGYDMVFTPESMDPKFLAYVLLSEYMLIGQIYQARNRAAQPHLNAEELGSFIIALPLVHEQEEIAHHLDNFLQSMDSAISGITKSVNILKEYREALITSAVTGQIDVRKELE
ncbi:MAG: restriction endonuclease subunit S, partial [Cytophagales bacterium]|nr:restriction endonuclease subunit S [Cytophagales bacterium]